MKRVLGNLQSFCIAVSLIAASAAEASAAPAAGPFRIAVVTGEDGACGPPGPNAPAGQAAYAAHLARRLARPVEVCPVADMAAAARLLADGKIDFAQLDPIAYKPVSAGVRPLLTARTQDGFGLVETVMVVRAGGPENLAPGPGERLGFAGTAPYELDLLKRALTDHGIAFAQPETARVYEGPSAAAARWSSKATVSMDRTSLMQTVQLGLWAVLQTSVLATLVVFAGDGGVTPADLGFAIAAILQLGGQLRGIGGTSGCFSARLGNSAKPWIF